MTGRAFIAVVGLLCALLIGCGDEETQTIVFSMPVSGEQGLEAEADVMERRGDALGVEVDADETGPGRLDVTIPADKQTAELIAAPTILNIYDWERNVIIAPGGTAEQSFSRLYDAVLLASDQEPECYQDLCSAPGPRYYLFDKESKKLVAGPSWRRADLDAGELPAQRREVLAVPQGALVIQEEAPPDDPETEDNEAESGHRGWYVLRDRPAVTGTEIAEAEPGTDPITEQPTLELELTPDGQEGFQELTEQLAARVDYASRIVTPPQPHFAVILDGEVAIIIPVNGSDIPDAANGLTLEGSFTSQEAEHLAAFLEIGPLPASLERIE